jgi:hypothetical protein
MNDPWTNDLYPEPRVLDLSKFGAERFTGEPPEVKWLVKDTIPKRAPSLIAALGDTGKGYKLLEIGFQVGVPPEPEPFKSGTTVINLNYCRPVLGGTVAAHGTAVIVAGEDSEATMRCSARRCWQRSVTSPSGSTAAPRRWRRFAPIRTGSTWF